MGLRTASISTRTLWAAAFALLLGLRILVSAGLMPTTINGHLAIITCPDAAESAPLALGEVHHHQDDGHSGHQHGTCPYAAASWLSFVGSDFAPLLLLLFAAFAGVSAIATAVAIIERRHLRPPLRGPPLLA